jgi:hypothetical protein
MPRDGSLILSPVQKSAADMAWETKRKRRSNQPCSARKLCTTAAARQKILVPLSEAPTNRTISLAGREWFSERCGARSGHEGFRNMQEGDRTAPALQPRPRGPDIGMKIRPDKATAWRCCRVGPGQRNRVTKATTSTTRRR